MHTGGWVGWLFEVPEGKKKEEIDNQNEDSNKTRDSQDTYLGVVRWGEVEKGEVVLLVSLE